MADHDDCRTCLAKGEAIDLRSWVEEGDLERAIGDGFGQADELVHPVLGERAAAVVSLRPFRGPPAAS